MSVGNLESLCRELSRECIRNAVPTEEPFFDLVWGVLRGRMFPGGKALSPEYWHIRSSQAEIISGLGLHGGEDLQAISIISTLSALMVVMASSGSNSKKGLDELATKYVTEFGTPEWALSHIKSLVIRHMKDLPTMVRPEIQPATAEQIIPPLAPEECYFSVWTEKGYGYGTELQYKEKYQRAPSSGGPRIWINLIAGFYSVLLDRKHKPVNLSGNPLELLCVFLRNFNKRILKQDLEQEMPDYPQVLQDLHRATFDVLRPFMSVEWGTARKLMPHAEGKPRIKLTFCLIDHYKAPGTGNENL